MTFRHQKLLRAITPLVLTTFISLCLQPWTAAAQASQSAGRTRALSQSVEKLAMSTGTPTALAPEERLGRLLADLHEDLRAAVPEIAPFKQARPLGGSRLLKADLGMRTKKIRAAHGELEKLYATVEQGFQDTRKRLVDAKLPREIIDRHEKAVAQYYARKATFEQLMSKVERADDGNNSTERQSALKELAGFMSKYPSAKPHQFTNPNKLPFGSPQDKMREPYANKKQYQASVSRGTRKQASAAPKTAAVAYLEETEDVQLTQAIRDLATNLDHNPAKIYNWVKNNIQFVPSYGSIQGSDLTLKNRRGNAFDTASLLIALFRASGIPARYVRGTIEIPADNVMNWVGGVSRPEAAQSLLGQGGIPNLGIISGGTVRDIRMEHVWVEAYVDYVPSRGAVNRQPDTWVPLDASFKQYQFPQGMDLKNHVQFDAQSVIDQATQGATIDATRGSIQNVNISNLETGLGAYQDQVSAYIGTQQNPKVGDVLGAELTVQEEHPILPGALPYKIVTTGNTFQALPEQLRWRFKTNLYASDGLGDSSSPLVEWNQSTPQLAGRKITLSFVPASQADLQLLNSYLPAPHADGSPIQPGELPRSLPGYLLHMKAEFRVDGQLVAQSTESFTMGSQVRQSNQFFDAARGSWSGGEDNDITVGEYNAIGLDLQGIGTQQVEAQRAKLQATKSRLEYAQQHPEDPTRLEGLTKEDTTGDMVYTGILSYFGQVDAYETLFARSRGEVVSYRLPSYGRFFVDAQPHYWFGIVRSVTFPGLVMDVDYLYQQVEARDANSLVRTRFTRQVGILSSAAEHAAPEIMFRNPNLPVDDPAQPRGVSAVKALAIAAAQGQKIYTLDQSNVAAHGSVLQSLQISQEVKAEIAYGLASGKEVLVHERDITVNQWTGAGYLIIDPMTGAGAYKIAGGANGAAITGLIQGAALGLVIVMTAFLATIAMGAIWVLWVAVAMLAVANLLVVLENMANHDAQWNDCYLGGLMFGLSVGFYAPPLIGAILFLLGGYIYFTRNPSNWGACVG